MASSILEAVTDNKNFGRYVLEAISWENDGDHYENNIFFFDTLEEIEAAIQAGQKAQSLYHTEDINKLTDFQIDLAGGFQYESDYPRVLESMSGFYIHGTGEIEKIC